jgi:hypothetical protein
VEDLEATAVYLCISTDPISDRNRLTLRVVCNDGRVIEEFVNRHWLRDRCDQQTDGQLTTPAGQIISLPPDVREDLDVQCRKMVAIPVPTLRKG